MDEYRGPCHGQGTARPCSIAIQKEFDNADDESTRVALDESGEKLGTRTRATRARGTPGSEAVSAPTIHERARYARQGPQPVPAANSRARRVGWQRSPSTHCGGADHAQVKGVGCQRCRVAPQRRRAQLPKQDSQRRSASAPLVIRQKIQGDGDDAPGQAAKRLLPPPATPQAIAQVGGSPIASSMIGSRARMSAGEIPPSPNRVSSHQPASVSDKSAVTSTGEKAGGWAARVVPALGRNGPATQNCPRRQFRMQILATRVKAKRERLRVCAPVAPVDRGDDHAVKPASAAPTRRSCAISWRRSECSAHAARPMRKTDGGLRGSTPSQRPRSPPIKRR